MYFHAVNTVQCPIFTANTHKACTRVGLRGSLVGPKMNKTDFFQNCSYNTWVPQTTGLRLF